MGRIGQAIEQTTRAYPGLLESNQNLLFMLKCRQFVEMVNGSDLDVSTWDWTSFFPTSSFYTPKELNFQTNSSHSAQTSVIQSTKLYQVSMDQNEQDFNNDNQNYSIYGDENHEQNSFNKFKRINDYIENHYHDSNSDDIDMDGNNIGELFENLGEALALKLHIYRNPERFRRHGRWRITNEQQIHQVRNRKNAGTWTRTAANELAVREEISERQWWGRGSESEDDGGKLTWSLFVTRNISPWTNFRRHLVCWRTQTHGPALSASSSLHRNANPFARNLIQLF